jgi:quinol monooxygenase YgiN
MILIEVELETTEAQKEDFLALLRATMAASRAEPGCVTYRFTADLDDPLRFYLIELWETEADLQNHFRGEGFRNFIAQMPQLGTVLSSVPRSGPLEPYKIGR